MTTPTRLLAAVADLEPPLAVVDLDAFDLNARILLARANSLPVRVGSKSVRCVVLTRRAIDAGFAGVLAFTPAEALHLLDAEVTDDVLVAYPTVDAAAIDAVVARAAGGRPAPILMADCAAHLRAVGERARSHGATVEVCLDVDLGLRLAGGRVHIGPKRSPVRTPAQAAALARLAAATDGVRAVGLLAYDGHIAGLGDDDPDTPLRSRAIRAMQWTSLQEIRRRLPRVVDAVRAVVEGAGGTLRFVNSSGTGSLDRLSAVGGVSELTAGSGLYASHLFDTYRGLSLQPSAGFVLPVVRRPSPEVATLLGGGYVASGAAGPDRLPRPWWPEGLELDRDEGAGEVQTPLRGPGARDLEVGDRVLLRHAKAGELCERFASLHLVAGGRVVDEVPTYRGEGRTFL